MESSQTTGTAAFGGNGTINPQTSAASPAESTIPATTSSSDDLKQNLVEVMLSIFKTRGNIEHLYLTVSTCDEFSPLPKPRWLDTLVMEMDNISKLSEKCNIKVPILIDDGKNPNEFTRDVLNSWIAQDQITKGQIGAFKAFFMNLSNHFQMKLEMIERSVHLLQMNLCPCDFHEPKAYYQTEM